MEKLLNLTEKNNLIKLVILLLYVITALNCKGQNNDNNKLYIKNEIENSISYDEVIFVKDGYYDTEKESRRLNINYKNYSFKFKFIQDVSFIEYYINDKMISDWKQIAYNFSYNSSLEEAEDKIRILYSEINLEGLLLLPGYSSEYPSFIVYKFNKEGFTYLYNTKIKDADAKKIGFEYLTKEWNSATFKVVKINNEYILNYIDKSITISFEIDKNGEGLRDENNELIDIINETPSSLKKRMETEGFYKLKSEIQCDLNQDNIKDEILIFKSKDDYNRFDEITYKGPIIIFIGTKNGKYEKYENSNIFPNNHNDFFNTIVTKHNFLQ